MHIKYLINIWYSCYNFKEDRAVSKVFIRGVDLICIKQKRQTSIHMGFKIHSNLFIMILRKKLSIDSVINLYSKLFKKDFLFDCFYTKAFSVNFSSNC